MRFGPKETILDLTWVRVYVKVEKKKKGAALKWLKEITLYKAWVV